MFSPQSAVLAARILAGDEPAARTRRRAAAPPTGAAEKRARRSRPPARPRSAPAAGWDAEPRRPSAGGPRGAR